MMEEYYKVLGTIEWEKADGDALFYIGWCTVDERYPYGCGSWVAAFIVRNVVSWERGKCEEEMRCLNSLCRYNKNPGAAGYWKDVRKSKRKRVPIRPAVRLAVLERDHFRCCLCGANVASGAVLEIDHIVPVDLGGNNDNDNLQTLCRLCNVAKSNRIVISHEPVRLMEGE